MKNVIDGVMYASMVRGGAAALSENRKTVNDLNVFPIPDGDTGDNMFMTINSGASVFKDNVPESIDESASVIAKGMLLGARGNSGVILSRIFSGISKGLSGVKVADVSTFSKAFESGVSEAYGAVAVPVEGTILTVYRDGVKYADSRITEESDFSSYFTDLVSEMNRSLERTPELLDVLKQAGVVDSGGAGLIYIAHGMKSALEGKAFEAAHTGGSAMRTVDVSAFTEDTEMKFGYCTEFLLRLQHSKTDISAFDLDKFIGYLHSAGDSVVAFREDTIVKVHVHTMRPGTVLDHCQQYGEFLSLKIENMTLQHNENDMAKKFSPKTVKPKKRYGIISVASGDGIRETFASLGCDCVVNGGQSMNPSAEDFIKAFSEINADTIFVFPNNGNIILTAKQAAALYDKAEVVIIPTKTIGEGYSAISMFDPGSKTTDEIVCELEEIISGVVTGEVSTAIRDAVMNGIEVKAGDHIGFVGDTIYSDASDSETAALGLLEKLDAGNYDIAIVICGENTSEDEAGKLYETLESRYKNTEIIMMNGGQPIYDYIIILE